MSGVSWYAPEECFCFIVHLYLILFFLCSIGVIGLANRVSEFLSAKPVINNLSRCYIQLCLIQWSNSSS